MANEEKLVLPGDEVKTDKRPGFGLYNEENKVFASMAGKLKESDDKIVVEPHKEVIELSKGDSIIGRVEITRDKMAAIRILKIVGKQRTLPTEDMGVIKVMDISDGYTENARDEFKVGDIIKAKVANVLPNDVLLTTKGSNLGVIEGYCSSCRSLLEMKGDKLVCTGCGRQESRKVSQDYLLVKPEDTKTQKDKA
jgi:exosome complex component CSL4